MKLFILVAIFYVLFAPLILLWGFNTLFPTLQLPYTFQTWLAVLAIGGVLTFKATFTTGGKHL